MALTGINIFETKDYISRHDTDKENPTVFKVGHLDAFISSEIEDSAAKVNISSNEENEITVKERQKEIMAIKFGLKGWENFLDPRTGKSMEFQTKSLAKNGKNYNVVSDHCLAVIPALVRKELADEILGISHLSLDEKKS